MAWFLRAAVMLDQPHDPGLILGPHVEVTVSSMFGSKVDLALFQFRNGQMGEVRLWFVGGCLNLLQAVSKAGHDQLEMEIENS